MTNLNIKEIFENARTCNHFSNREIQDSLLEEVFRLAELGPTSANCLPLRIFFIKSIQEKEKLLACLMPGNVEKSRTAPVVALFAYDSRFFDQMPKLFPMAPQMAEMYKNNPALAQETEMRNSSLQAAYFIIAARGLGLDCGPMSGFDADKVNESFFSGTSYKVNFICNLGYKADDEPKYPRLPRLNFNEACKIV